MNDPLRKRRCCLLGPSPEWLKRPEDDIRVDLENSVMAAVREGLNTFVCGLDRGTGIWGAEIVVRLRNQFPDMGLRLVACVPYPGFDEEWDASWRDRYRVLLSLSEYVRVLSPYPSPAARRIRNEWAVIHSVRLIAVCVRDDMETREAVFFAGKNRVPVSRVPG